ncbi:MAG TPA: phosphoribosylformylglycinamidine synthase subunit PurS [Chitinophagaceae bacterium]|nr:phosphoribosylformylglycinamidine synthase subunit PurS [Chitinophagaceae bacterium]
MMFTIRINVMPLKELLDPQGKAVAGGLERLGIAQVREVRIGKRMILKIEASGPQEARQIAEQACSRLLANPVMEYFEIELD